MDMAYVYATKCALCGLFTLRPRIQFCCKALCGSQNRFICATREGIIRTAAYRHCFAHPIQFANQGNVVGRPTRLVNEFTCNEHRIRGLHCERKGLQRTAEEEKI